MIWKWSLARLAILDGVLALILIALVALGNAAAAEGPPPVPEPGDLLYVTTFDDFNDEWDLYPGRNSAEVVDGALQVSINKANTGVFSPLDRVFGDFDLTVEATTLDGPIDNGFGVIFRHQDEDNFYQFLISSDCCYKIMRVKDGVVERLSAKWPSSQQINLGIDAVNVIRVVGRGDRFQFYINGELLELCLGRNAIPATCEGGELTDTLVDASLAYGRVGVGAVTTMTGGEGVTIGFDDVVIVGPEGEAEAEVED